MHYIINSFAIMHWNYHFSLYGSATGYWLRNGRETFLEGSWPSKAQPSLLSCRGQLNYWNFAWTKFANNTFQLANNKGADPSEQICRLVCAFVVFNATKSGFLTMRPILVFIVLVISRSSVEPVHPLTRAIAACAHKGRKIRFRHLHVASPGSYA